MKHRILFVDDEPNILRGLRRILRSKRSEWDMDFANGGEEALEKIESQPPDAVVTDMRMPVMDGLELLTRVTERNPDIIRLVLSGQAQKEAIIGIFKAAHQFLSKPCQADLIKSKLSRLLDAKTLIPDGQLCSRIAGAEPLAASRSNLNSLVQEIEKEDPGPEVVGGIIAEDPAMAAYLFKITGSSFFGDCSGQKDFRKIVEILGMDTVGELVNKHRIVSAFGNNSEEDKIVADISEHSVRVSELAGKIASAEECDDMIVKDSMIAGLLHDIGRNIFLSCRDTYDLPPAVLQDEFSDDFIQFEKEAGSTHAQIGAVLGIYWGYSEDITRAIIHHHEPSRTESGEFDCLTAVHAAESLLEEENNGNRLDIEYLSRLGIDRNIEKWRGLKAEKVVV